MRYTVKAKYRPNYGGFYRSGRFWPNGGVEVDETEITDAMEAEPMLIIAPIISQEEPVITTKPSRRPRRGK